MLIYLALTLIQYMRIFLCHLFFSELGWIWWTFKTIDSRFQFGRKRSELRYFKWTPHIFGVFWIYCVILSKFHLIISNIIFYITISVCILRKNKEVLDKNNSSYLFKAESNKENKKACRLIKCNLLNSTFETLIS